MAFKKRTEIAPVGFDAEGGQMIDDLLPAFVLAAHRDKEVEMRRELRLKWFSGHSCGSKTVVTGCDLLSVVVASGLSPHGRLTTSDYDFGPHPASKRSLGTCVNGKITTLSHEYLDFKSVSCRYRNDR